MNSYIDKFPLPYCAAKFLMQWVKREKHLHSAMSTDPQDTDIFNALAYFQVSRNFKGLRRKADCIKIALSGVLKTQQLTSELDKVTALAENFFLNFGSFNLSASSKLLWLSYRSPFIVYDSRTVKALSSHFGYKFDSSNYAEYCEAWRDEYRKNECEIELAITSLPNGRAFMYQSNLSDQELFDLSKQSWFKERVFDIFLWEVGGDSLPRA